MGRVADGQVWVTKRVKSALDVCCEDLVDVKVGFAYELDDTAISSQVFEFAIYDLRARLHGLVRDFESLEEVRDRRSLLKVQCGDLVLILQSWRELLFPFVGRIDSVQDFVASDFLGPTLFVLKRNEVSFIDFNYFAL